MKYNVQGYNLDNLLKTLYQKKIVLYNIVRKDYKNLEFETEDKNAKKVNRLLLNFKVQQTFGKLKMLPKFLLANIGVVLGVFIGAVFLVFASAYTWQIEVYGTEELSVNEILSVLEENGIKKGKINTQTSEQIEDVLMNNYDRIAQVSVIRQGTAIIINLSEKLVYVEEEFKPLVATHNGIITDIQIVTGTTNVKVGEYVNKGDVLVLPFNITAEGKKVSVKPLAEITAEMFVVGKTSLNKLETNLVRTGKTKKVYRYQLFNLNLFWGKNKNSFALFETEVYNENISDIVPLKRKVYTYYELAPKEIEHDFEKEKFSLQEESKTKAYGDLPNGQILDEKNSLSIIDNTMYATTTIKVLGIIND